MSTVAVLIPDETTETAGELGNISAVAAAEQREFVEGIRALVETAIEEYTDAAGDCEDISEVITEGSTALTGLATEILGYIEGSGGDTDGYHLVPKSLTTVELNEQLDTYSISGSIANLFMEINT